MPRLNWGEGARLYDQGVDQGVLYVDGVGVPWNGLVSVDEADTTEVDVDHYFEGRRLWVTQIVGAYEAVVSAYTYPDAFAEYNGYSEKQQYKRFGMSYRTQHGNGYQIHVIYRALVDQNTRSWATVKPDLDPSLFQWPISAEAVPIPGARPSARVSMTFEANSTGLSAVEDILYGTTTTSPRLPTAAELYAIYEEATMLRIVYHNDGSYTATGPDEFIRLLGNGLFELSAPSVFLESQDIFRVSSY